MPTVTVTVDAGASGTMTRSRTVTGPHLTRFISAVRTCFKLGAGRTDLEVLEFWADMVIFQGARDIAKSGEAQSAVATVTTIDFT